MGVTVMFWHGKLYTLVFQKTTLLVLFLRTSASTWTYSIDEVCNFLCQNMTVTPKIATAFALLYFLSPFSTHVFRRRWRNFSPAKKLFSCSFVPSAKGQTEDENFQQLDQQNKYLQRRMNVKKLFLCQNFSPAAAK